MASLSPAHSLRSAPADSVMAPQHFLPPTPRELRAQAMHRLQIGVLGLASMLLLIGLANIIMDRARISEAARGGVAATATEAANPGGSPEDGANDPLADIGVVPDLPAGAEMPAAAAQPSPDATGDSALP